MNFNNIANMFKSNDVILAVGLVIIISMMILPLPAPLLDILLTLNISLSVIIMFRSIRRGKEMIGQFDD
jgi:flagellar biosynthesis component FlhA